MEYSKTKAITISLSLFNSLAYCWHLGYQRRIRKEVCLYEKTVRSGAAKKPMPVYAYTIGFGNVKKVFFISFG